jgi:hypothetical protein
VNFPFICSNTPTARAYGVYISQLIRYLRAFCQNVLHRGLLLTRKQFQLAKLKSSLRNFYSRHLESINSCGIYDHGYVPFVISTLRSCAHSCLITWFVTRVTRRVPIMEQEPLTLPVQLSSAPYFSWVRVTRSLVWCVMFCRSLFVLLSFFSCSHCVLLQVALVYVPSVCTPVNFYIRIVHVYSC